MTAATPMTAGAHHIGLTVADLDASAAFFTRGLGWQEVRRDLDYPAVFVSDGVILVTLWQRREGPEQRNFDKNHHSGLHHVAFRVDSEERLQAIHRRLETFPGVRIEFAPELLRQGPARHMMCHEPGGIRVEFIWPGG